MGDDNAIKSLMIAALATALDQGYHILFGLGHQIFFIAAQTETQYYIGIKFLIVAAVSYTVLSRASISHYRSAAMSGIIGVVSAALFSFALVYISSYTYTFWLHLFHAAAIGLAAYITIEYLEDLI